MTRKLGIGIAGTGSILAYHAEALARLPEIALRALAGRDPAKAEVLAARYGFERAVDGFEALIARDDVDAVVIATPDDTHADLAMAAIQAGKHVLVQKPLAPDADSCLRLVAAANAARVDLQASFMHRYFPETLRALELVRAGAIGKIESMRLRNATPGPDWADWFFRKDRNPGGVVQQLGVHGIDLALLFGGPIVSVRATTSIQRPTRTLSDGRAVRVETPDSAWAVYGFAGGTKGAHEMSMIESAGTDRFRLELYGEAGAMWLRGDPGPLAIRKAGDAAWRAVDLPRAPMGEAHHRSWVDGILGRAPRSTSARDAADGLRVMAAILESDARAGSEVAL